MAWWSCRKRWVKPARNRKNLNTQRDEEETENREKQWQERRREQRHRRSVATGARRSGGEWTERHLIWGILRAIVVSPQGVVNQPLVDLASQATFLLSSSLFISFFFFSSSSFFITIVF